MVRNAGNLADREAISSFYVNSDRVNTFKVAFLTASSIFIMGFLNALALNTYDLGTMISAQSGNVVWMGLNLAGGYWVAFIENLGLLFGFAGGAAFALMMQNVLNGSSAKCYFNWTVFIVPIIIYPLVMQYVVPPWLSYIVLGFACGAALGFFRKMYHLEINNAMATGSARFLGLEFIHGVVHKDKLAQFSLLIFATCVVAFSGGAWLYAMLLRLDHHLAFGIRISLGTPDDHIRFERLHHGFFEYLPEPNSNLARIIGLVLICCIPYLFCPRQGKALKNFSFDAK